MIAGNEDTIVAPGTRAGEAAIGIVKISGQEAIKIADKIFYSKNGKKLFEMNTYSMLYGYIKDHRQKIIDEVVVSLMKAPGSYTREDVIEINCHGGLAATAKVLELCIEEGARIAEPGEFTKRAFLNGRIDLSQAEAVIELVRSKTEQSLKIAANNLKGNIKKETAEIKEDILDILVQLEASIDFIEEDLETVPYNKLKGKAKNLKKRLENLIEDEKKGEILKNGIKAVIVGKPNVGKSSLLNILSKKEKAIVTKIPGTTRDAIEEILYIEGIPLILIDTAGIRNAKNSIERIGVERSLRHIDEAELVLLVVDGSKRLSELDYRIIEKVKNKKTICCINKIDLKQYIERAEIDKKLAGSLIVEISALKGEGIKELEESVKRSVLENGGTGIEEKIIINSRHKRIIKEVKNLVASAIDAMSKELSEEFPSSDLKIAYNLIGEITGDTAGEDVLNRIFNQFCIGK